MKAVWFAEAEIEEATKCEVCGKVFKEGFIVEPESQDVNRLQKLKREGYPTGDL
jgi:hypothetical protein